jgi:ABC-2 type transport system permease protein
VKRKREGFKAGLKGLLKPEYEEKAAVEGVSFTVRLIFIFFTVVVNCLAFWLGGTDGLSAQLFNALVTFTTYPTGIFRGVGKLLLFTVVPAGFISYLPIGQLRDADPLFMLGVVGVAGVLTVGGIWLFHAGLKRYTSGNMMGLRR